MKTTTEAPLRTAFLNRQRALDRRPDLGRSTAVTQVRLLRGLTCEIEEGPWRLTVDMSPKSGGDDAGPNPGILGRSALGSCLAMTYQLWAAYLNIPLDQLEVEIQADYDVRGMYNFPVPPEYSEVRYVVRLRSEAPESRLRELFDLVEEHTAYLQIFRRPMVVRGEMEVAPLDPPEGGEG